MTTITPMVVRHPHLTADVNKFALTDADVNHDNCEATPDADNSERCVFSLALYAWVDEVWNQIAAITALTDLHWC